MINYPIEMCELVTDQQGNQTFGSDHPCTQAFSEGMESRRADDGYCYDKFQLHFEVEQDPTFVSVMDVNLRGFDLLCGKYANSDGELCDFKILYKYINACNSHL